MLTTQSLLRCPQCHAQISIEETRASCVNHHEYAVDSGIVAFLRELTADTHIRPLDHCCEAGGVDYRTDHYILPWMRRHALGGNLAGLKVLEDGAGGGQQVRRYVDEGLDAYGIDPGSRSQQWKSLDLDGRMFIADGCDLPFEDESFDFVTSSGVLEHVGEPRQLPQRDPYQGEYIREILRVLKPGGMALMAQPNGANPIDFWHPIRGTVRVHKPYEKWMPDIYQIRRWVATSPIEHEVRFISPRGYLAFERVRAYWYGRMFSDAMQGLFAVTSVVPWLARTWINPWMVVEITRSPRS
jgi:SAM-dependent methyltransferase